MVAINEYGNRAYVLSVFEFSTSFAFNMNATIFEMDYWYYKTTNMPLDWQLIVDEMIVLFIFCILAIGYAWCVEIEANKVQVKEKNKDKKLCTV